MIRRPQFRLSTLQLLMFTVCWFGGDALLWPSRTTRKSLSMITNSFSYVTE
jgi:hypothetical protein